MKDRICNKNWRVYFLFNFLGIITELFETKEVCYPQILNMEN